jgi:hypothetical protein
MSTSAVPLTKTGRELVDVYFIENRTRVLEIAAFLDRLDRAEDSPESDFRLAAFRETLQVLSSGTFPRVEKIQMILSDPTTEPLAQVDAKSAWGAYDRSKRGG